MTPVLEAVDLSKHFPVRGLRNRRVVHAVDGVSLALHPGRITALVGESGSGKSTFARLLAQLYLSAGSYEDALKTMRKDLELFPGDDFTRSQLQKVEAAEAQRSGH